MAEGDTIHRHAAELRPLLVGKPLVAAYQRGLPVARLAGACVLAVEARGKHLLIETDRGIVAHVHLGMTGTWRRARRPSPTSGRSSAPTSPSSPTRTSSSAARAPSSSSARAS